jgi:hypothetical protein
VLQYWAGMPFTPAKLDLLVYPREPRLLDAVQQTLLVVLRVVQPQPLAMIMHLPPCALDRVRALIVSGKWPFNNVDDTETK